MILCDLCGNQKECFQKEIDGREFDICADCWWPLGREAERQRAVEKEAGDGFSASTDHAKAGGAKDAAGPASEDYWPSRKGQLTLVADFHAAVT